MEVRKAAGELRAIWVLGNEYLQSAAPWTQFKTNPDLAAAQVRFALNLAVLYAGLSSPFIPDASDKLAKTFGLDAAAWPEDVDATLATLAPGHAFTVPDVLFAKISDDDRDAWAAQFAGA